MFGGNVPAVFILRRVIGDGSVHAGNLDADLAPLGAYFFPAARQGLPDFISPSAHQELWSR